MECRMHFLPAPSQAGTSSPVRVTTLRRSDNDPSLHKTDPSYKNTDRQASYRSDMHTGRCAFSRGLLWWWPDDTLDRASRLEDGALLERQEAAAGATRAPHRVCVPGLVQVGLRGRKKRWSAGCPDVI